MFAVIDSGTTTTRIYIVNENGDIVASGRTKVGVRDTSITGSRDKLRNGVAKLFYDVLSENGISDDDVSFAISSGMITSEIGLIEIPHIVAPAGIEQLTKGMLKVEDPNVLPIGRPVYFIRGIRNNYPQPATIRNLPCIDFMRGEETQCIGIMTKRNLVYPCNLVALSSHTKIMYINENREIVFSKTTISGQIYEALVASTNIGKSIVDCTGEQSGGYSYEELVEVAMDIVFKEGFIRSCMAPRFMQVLLNTDSSERKTFIDAAIASEDLYAFKDMRARGYASRRYILYGQEERCKMYKYMLEKTYGDEIEVEIIYKKEDLDRMTTDGAIAIASNLIKTELN